MANFDTIKTAIDANINTNGNQAITGAVMNSVLNQMIDSTEENLTELESKGVIRLSYRAISNIVANLEVGEYGWNDSTNELIKKTDADGNYNIYIPDVNSGIYMYDKAYYRFNGSSLEVFEVQDNILNSIIMLEGGSINVFGIHADNEARVRTTNSIIGTFNVFVPNPSIVVYAVVYYNEDGTFNSYEQINKRFATNIGKDGCIAKLVFSHNDLSSSIAPSDIKFSLDTERLQSCMGDVEFTAEELFNFNSDEITFKTNITLESRIFLSYLGKIEANFTIEDATGVTIRVIAINKATGNEVLLLDWTQISSSSYSFSNPRPDLELINLRYEVQGLGKGVISIEKENVLKTDVDILKEHSTIVTTDVDILKEHIAKVIDKTNELTTGTYINTSGEIGDVVSTDAISAVGFNSMVFECKQGDIVILTGRGGNKSRLWCFVDENYAILSNALSEASVSDVQIVAPKNSKYVIINVNNSYDYNIKLQQLINMEKEFAELRTDMIPIEMGAINAAGGINTVNNKRARTIGYINGNFRVIAPEGFIIYLVMYYDKNTLQYMEYEQPLSKDFVIGRSGYVARCVFAKEDYTSSFTLNELKNSTTIDDAISKDALPINIASFDYNHTLADVQEYISDFDFTTWTLNTMMEQVYEHFDTLVAQYPNLISKVDAAEEVGLTYPSYASSYKTYLYKLSNGTLAGKQKILLIGATHGIEVASSVNCYILAKMMCEGATSNHFAMLSNADFYIIPCLNGAGILNQTRVNGNQIDINRNFPVPNWQMTGSPGSEDYSGENAGSEFEVQLIMAQFNRIQPDIAVDHHNYWPDLGRAFYTDPVSEDGKKLAIRSLIDCSYAFCKGVPAYFGNTPFIVGHHVNINHKWSTPGIMSTWFGQEIEKAATIEINCGTSYNNGSVTSDTTLWDYYSESVFSIAEYTLRIQLMRMIEW